jgi:methoxymalonate biosynthesis acyl carrier protein
MTAEQVSEKTPINAESIQDELLCFLAERIKTAVAPDQDLFKTGLVSSMFAMQLVVHLEQSYDIAIIGPDAPPTTMRLISPDLATDHMPTWSSSRR